MIPKIIHYCWLSGDPFPEKILHCINTWHKVLPDYEFVLWDTTQFPLEKSQWVREAFDAEKYAFAADYIRLYAVYNFGGIYLDSDVEVLKSFDELLELPYFIGKEGFSDRVEVAAFGAEKGTPWLKSCLDYYEGRAFKLDNNLLDTRVMPDIVHDIISHNYVIKSINNIVDFDTHTNVFCEFPNDWFCANVHITPDAIDSTYIVSPNTYCVHHFTNSWVKVNKVKFFIKRNLVKWGIIKQ